MSEARETLSMPGGPAAGAAKARTVAAAPAKPTASGAPAARAAGHGNPNASADTLSDRVRSLRLQPSGPTPRPRSTWLMFGMVVVVLVVGSAFGWHAYRRAALDSNPSSGGLAASGSATSDASDKSAESPGSTATTGATHAATTAAAPAASGDVVLDSKGYLIAAHQIQLSPQVGGEIIWLDPNFKEGAVYKKGDRLAEIDPVIFAAQLDSAQAALRVAQTNLQQVETGSTLQDIETCKAQMLNLAAKLAMSRIDERYNLAAGIAVSLHDKEKATAQVKIDETAYEVQKATLVKLQQSLEEQRLVARAQVLSAQAALQQATKQLKNCTIVAPTTGIILSKKAELGGYVNPLAFGAAGYLCEMADLKDLEVELDIQERDISRVMAGQRCRIMPEAGQHDEAFLKTHPSGYGGVVSRRMPVANRAKGAVTVRVSVEIPEREPSGEYLLPDMGVLVSFLK